MMHHLSASMCPSATTIKGCVFSANETAPSGELNSAPVPRARPDERWCPLPCTRMQGLWSPKRPPRVLVVPNADRAVVRLPRSVAMSLVMFTRHCEFACADLLRCFH